MHIHENYSRMQLCTAYPLIINEIKMHNYIYIYIYIYIYGLVFGVYIYIYIYIA